MSKIVLIGANHAGTAAANTILDHYPDAQVTIFDRNSNISYLGCGTALWIGKQIEDTSGLFYCSAETFKAKKAKVLMEAQINNIDFDQKIVNAVDKDGNDVSQEYDKLILATGSLPIMPRITGIDLANIFCVKLYQDAIKINECLLDENIKRVAIMGAGYIGVEIAEAVQRRGKEALLFDIEDRSLASYYDEWFTKDMDENLAKNGVQLHLGEKIVEFKGDAKVNSVVTDKGEYNVDMVILAIGFRPNNELGKDSLELFSNGAYKVNKRQETSKKDVYAIGDCATVYSNALQATSYIALATNAVRSGVVAAHNVCGTELESNGVQGSNGISIYGYNMVSTGLTEKAASLAGFEVLSTQFEDLQKPAFIKNNHKVKIKIVYCAKTRRILGAQIASFEEISMAIHMFSLAIEQKVTIDSLKLLDIFFLPHFNQPYNYITMAALTAK
ncbi:NADH oxidase [Clostridia bacterium]|nr:NADH oxidase [Clostridia bacterium]